MMITHTLIFALLLFVSQSVTFDQIQFNTFSCNFSLFENNGSKQNLTFNSCQWKGCQKWSENPSQKICINEINIVSKRWQTCIQKCCGNSALPQSYQTLNECYQQQIPKSWWQRVRKYLLYFFIIVCICDRTQHLIAKIVQRMPKKIHEEQMCVICMQNHVNARFNCKHYYHIHCAASEMKQRNSCPMCKFTISSVKIYCKKCRYMRNQYGAEIFKNNTFLDYCGDCR